MRPFFAGLKPAHLQSNFHVQLLIVLLCVLLCIFGWGTLKKTIRVLYHPPPKAETSAALLGTSISHLPKDECQPPQADCQYALRASDLITCKAYVT
jgi:hypothetical protein